GFSEFNVSPAAAQVNGIVRRLGFSMFAFVTTWIQYRRQKRAAIEAAVRHFDATTGRKALPRISSVIGELNGDLVVRVCHGQQKPPGRAWYLVSKDNVVLSELSFEEVVQLGECYWR